MGGTWRVGGLLALSRAFGDAYLKGGDQFEGVSFYASDSYASGFGERLWGLCCAVLCCAVLCCAVPSLGSACVVVCLSYCV